MYAQYMRIWLRVGLLTLVLVATGPALLRGDEPLSPEAKQKLKDQADRLNSEAVTAARSGLYDRALPLFTEALKIREELYKGQDHPAVAGSLSNLGAVHASMGRLDQAHTFLERALKMNERLYLNQDHPDLFKSLSSMSRILEKLGQPDKAKPFHERAVKMNERLAGIAPDPALPGGEKPLSEEKQKLKEQADKLDSEAGAASKAGKPTEALRLARECLDLREQLYKGEDSFVLARSLSNVGFCYRTLRQFNKALPYYERALAMRERLFKDQDHAVLAQCLSDVGLVLWSLGQYEKSLPHYERALTMRERLYKNQDHPILVTSLSDVGDLFRDLHQLDKAVTYFEKSLAMRDRLYPNQDTPALVASLRTLGGVLWKHGQLDSALSHSERALRVCGRLYPNQDNFTLALSLARLGGILQDLGQDQQALVYHELGLKMVERIYPNQDHRAIAASLDLLGEVLMSLRQHEKALTCRERALRIRERLYKNQDNDEVASSLINMGTILALMGQADKGLPYAERSLQMRERLYPDQDHPSVASSLSGLGIVLNKQKRHDKALPFFERCLQMRERLSKGQDDMDLANALINMGVVLNELGRRDQGITYAERALKMYERIYKGRDHPGLALSLNNYACALDKSGQPARGVPYAERALKMCERLSPNQDSPSLACSLLTLGEALVSLGQFDKALPYYERQFRVNTRILDREVTFAPEAQALEHLTTLYDRRDVYLQLSRTQSTEADRVAEHLWLSRAVVTRILECRHLAGHDTDEIRALREKLANLRAHLTGALMRPTADPRREVLLREITEEKEKGERTLLQLLPPRVRPGKDITPADLAAILPTDAVYLDVLRYDDQDENKKPQARYAAFVHVPKGKTIRIDLGIAQEIDAAANAWRGAVLAYPNPKVSASGRAELLRTAEQHAGRLRDRVWARIAPTLPGEAQTVYQSVEGDLGRFPFAALPGDKPDTVLLEKYTFVDVPHGPALVQRLRARPGADEGKGTLLVVGGVDFGSLAEGQSGYIPLPGAARERVQLEKMAGGRVQPALGGTDATTTRLLAELPKATYAHLGTHGQFQADLFEKDRQAAEAYQKRLRTSEVGGDTSSTTGLGTRSPLGYVGLALAGANTPDKAGPDGGILTGEAIAGLKLEGLRLAVLSACETGLGANTDTEGVRGLQRAFHVAGCPDVVASLWTVNDEATAALMNAFWELVLVEKMEPARALRKAQLLVYLHPDLVRELATRGGKFSKVVRINPDKEPEPAPTVGGPRRSPPYLWAPFFLSATASTPLPGQDPIVVDPIQLKEQAARLTKEAIATAQSGKTAQALPLFAEALKLNEQIHKDQNHRDLAGSLTNMGLVLKSLGQADKALPYFERALKMRETIYKDQDHRDLVQSLHNMGSILQALGQAEKAIPFKERAAKMQVRLAAPGLPGGEEPLTEEKQKLKDQADKLDGEAGTLLQARKAAEALPLLTECLKLREQLYMGKDHPKLAESLSKMGLVLWTLRQYERSLPHYERALTMRERLYKNQDHPVLVTSLSDVGDLFRDLHQLDKAVTYFERSLAMRDRLYPNQDTPALVHSLHTLGMVLGRLGQHNTARGHYERALQVSERLYPNQNHLTLASSQNRVAMVLQALGQPDKALPYCERALKMREALLQGQDHPALAQSLEAMGVLLYELGQEDRALPYYERALRMNEALYTGRDHPALAGTLLNLGNLLGELNQVDRALPICERALKMCEALYKEDHPALAGSLANMGNVLLKQGKADKALPYHERALKMTEALHKGKDHPQLANSLNNLGGVLQALGQADKALPYAERALKMHETVYKDQNHHALSQSLHNMGLILMSLGQADRALPFFERGLKMIEALHQGRDHPELAKSLTLMGSFLRESGQADRALPLFERALKMREALHKGQDHHDLATTLDGVGWVLCEVDQADRALPFLERALQMNERLHKGKDHHDLARSLDSMGMVLDKLGQFDKALAYMQRAVVMEERIASGQDTRDLALHLNNLASVLCQLGRADKALIYAERALRINERLHPNQDHATVAHSLHQMGYFLSALGQEEKALTYDERALQMNERLHKDKDHPKLARSLNAVAVQLEKLGQAEKALPYAERAVAMQERLSRGHDSFLRATYQLTLGEVLVALGQYDRALPYYEHLFRSNTRILEREVAFAPEAQALERLTTLWDRRDDYLRLTRPAGRDADRVAESLWVGRAVVTRLLERRHLAPLDTDEIRVLREKLDALRARLTGALLRPTTDPMREQLLREVIEAKEKAERQLLTLLPPRLRSGQDITPTDLAAILPLDAVYVDILRYADLDKARKSQPRYVAFAHGPGAKTVRIDLGVAREIDAAANAWREVVLAFPKAPANDRGELQRNADKHAGVVKSLVWDRIAPTLPGGTATVYLSVEGDLGRLPFAALPGGKDTVLLEKYAFVHVPHGPALVQRLRTRTASDEVKGNLLVVGGVDFGVPPEGKGGYGSLPGTSRERVQLEKMGGSRVQATLGGSDATTTRLLAELPKATFAHLGTHGQFQADLFEKDRQNAARFQERLKSFEIGGDNPIRPGHGTRSPLGYVGLALAGANTPDKAGPDGGILTGEAIAGLKLEGLRLAVLSACETGLGANTDTEGVRGLQRAFHVAGCPDVVASLWEVNDEATAALMNAFWERVLVEKMEPARALREAQLLVYRRPDLVPVLATRGGAFSKAVKVNPDREPEPVAVPVGSRRSPAYLWAPFFLSGSGR